MINNNFKIVFTEANEFVNERGAVIEKGRRMSRLRLLEGDSRFDVAIKHIQKNQELLPKEIQKVQSGRYIRLLEENGDTILLKIRSIKNRLHLTPDQVHYAIKENKFRLLERQAKTLSMLFDLCKNQNEDQVNPHGEQQNAFGLMIGCLKKARNTNVATQVALKHINLTLMISTNDQGFAKIHAITGILGKGSFALVGSLVNIVSGKESAFKLLKRPIGMKKQDWEKAVNDIWNEYKLLHHLHSGGMIKGLQEPPKRMLSVQFSDPSIPESLGYITKKYDGNYGDEIEKLISYQERIGDFQQLLHCLMFFEAAGVMHGDVKDGNVLTISENGQRKVAFADLGGATMDVSKRVRHLVLNPESMGHTHLSILCHLINRNDIQEIKKFEIKRDVFALGVIFFRALSSGSFPYPFIGRFLNMDEPYRNLPQDVPENLQEMIKGMLHPDYNQRLSADQAYTFFA